jgi:uncharacterized membrane protein YhaH (DUF805 family)
LKKKQSEFMKNDFFSATFEGHINRDSFFCQLISISLIFIINHLIVALVGVAEPAIELGIIATMSTEILAELCWSCSPNPATSLHRVSTLNY